MQHSRKAQPFTSSLLENYDNIIFDCDGVIWHNYNYIDGIPQTIQTLQERGKNIFFCTNNSTKPRSFYTDKFAQSPSFAAIKANQIFTSASTSAIHLETLPGFDKLNHKVLVIGSRGIETELRDRGFTIITGDEATKDIKRMDDLKNLTLDPAVRAVVCGLDPAMTYFKAAVASLFVRELGATLISTNQDKTFPCSASRQLPAGGSIVAMIETGSGKLADNMGKPSQHMMNAIFTQHKLDERRTLMVGDRIDTDIIFGNSSGVDTLLVFSGVTSRSQFMSTHEHIADTANTQDATACPSPKTPEELIMIPTFIADDITCLTDTGQGHGQAASNGTTPALS